MSKNGLILITFAWAMEIVGVSLGFLNSTYTTFGEDLPQTISGYIPALPMLALAIAELGRVPLTSVIFHRHKVTQAVAILGLVALGYLAVENWTIGFDRIVELRLGPVSTAQRDLSRAEAELSTLKKTLTEDSSIKRDELQRAIKKRDDNIATLSEQLDKEAKIYQERLHSIQEGCLKIRERCMVPQQNAERSRYERAENQLKKTIEHERSERNQLQSQIDGLASNDAREAEQLQQKIAATQASVSELRHVFQSAADRNPIYRIGTYFYGVDALEPEQLARVRLVFATFSAIAVAFAGSVAALVYYARSRVPGTPTQFGIMISKAVRAWRAYYARKRKAVVREVPGPEVVIYRDGKEPPTVVEKEVVRLVDQIFLIPRWGITSPVHVNSFLRRNKGKRTSVSKDQNNVDATPNVRPLKRKAG